MRAFKLAVNDRETDLNIHHAWDNPGAPGVKELNE